MSLIPWMIVLASCTLAALPVAVIMTVGALKMLRLELYGLAVTAAILAMLPIHPGFLLGIPIGIWALWVLRQPNVRTAFAQIRSGEVTLSQSGSIEKPLAAHHPNPDIRQRLKMPAAALIMVGALHLVALAGGVALFVTGQVHRDSLTLAVLFMLGVWALAMLLGSLLIPGGLQMLSCRSYGMAKAACVIAIMPFSPLWIVSMPVGIWALAALHSPAVQREFEFEASAVSSPPLPQ